MAAIKFGVSPPPVYAVYDRRIYWRRQILAKTRNSPNSPNIIARQNLLNYSILCRLVYPGYVAFCTCYNCVTQDKNLTALTEFSAIYNSECSNSLFGCKVIQPICDSSSSNHIAAIIVRFCHADVKITRCIFIATGVSVDQCLIQEWVLVR